MCNRKDINVLVVPYEGLDDFMRGTSLAPSKILWALESIEEFSIYQNSVMPKINVIDGIYPTHTWLEPSEAMERIFSNLSEAVCNLEKPFVALGGDHAITYPIVKFVGHFYDDLKVIHFDAHLDRRGSYKGNRFSHASVMARVSELLGDSNVVTFGYRSRSEDEPEVGYPFSIFDGLKRYLDELPSDAPIYLTVDLDVLDPSEFPSVSNPEPGGVSFKELLESLKLLRGRNLVAADIVEYNPLVCNCLHSAVMAATILRELSIILVSHELD